MQIFQSTVKKRLPPSVWLAALAALVSYARVLASFSDNVTASAVAVAQRILGDAVFHIGFISDSRKSYIKPPIASFFLLVVLLLHKVTLAQVILDADGKPLPEEVAALIGRKFQALPVDPKLGDTSPVYPRLGAWRPIELEGTEAQLMRSKKWDADVRENHTRRIKQLKRDESTEYLQGKVVCSIGAGHGWKNSKYVIETVVRSCTDDSFEILDAIVLPKNFGWIRTHQIMPKNVSNNEYRRRKELDLLKTPGRAFLPSKFFKTSYCPFYLVFSIAVDANSGKGYEVDRAAGKFVRSRDPEMMADNPNPFCGAQT